MESLSGGLRECRNVFCDAFRLDSTLILDWLLITSTGALKGSCSLLCFFGHVSYVALVPLGSVPYVGSWAREQPLRSCCGREPRQQVSRAEIIHRVSSEVVSIRRCGDTLVPQTNAARTSSRIGTAGVVKTPTLRGEQDLLRLQQSAIVPAHGCQLHCSIESTAKIQHCAVGLNS